MNRLTFGALLSASLAFWLTSGSVFAQGSKFEEARTHIEKWVQTRQLIARRNADWRVERESIGQTIGLLQREIDLLKEAIDKSEQVDSEADAEKKRITLSLEDLKKANEVVDAALGNGAPGAGADGSFPRPAEGSYFECPLTHPAGEEGSSRPIRR